MYIDGVFSGGGIKGFALIGAYEALEKKGLQFKRLAGTSAGSIIAALILVGYSSAEIKKMMDEINLSELLDSRKTIIPFPFAKWLFIYRHLGLYKGDAIEAWLALKLAEKGVVTFGDLPPGALRVVASDLTTSQILVLPDDLKNYGIIPEKFPVAKAIRMSCSIPYFFEPVKLRPPTGKSIIVDGGVLSNFPIWLFDNEGTIQTRPVLGIKLSGNSMQQKPNKIDNAIELYSALFETMQKAHDARYISRRHEKNIIFIPVEGGITTEFSLGPEKKGELIDLGRKSTDQFLKTWSY